MFVASTAWAQENGTAYIAFRVVGTRLNREAVNHVISVTGSMERRSQQNGRFCSQINEHAKVCAKLKSPMAVRLLPNVRPCVRLQGRPKVRRSILRHLNP